MDSNDRHDPAAASPTVRVLVAADSWLHGIDWAGEPLASVPCAQRQVAKLTGLASEAGRTFARADVGDPEPFTAIGDALLDWPADELMICARPSHAGPHPFDLAHRAHRATGLSVQRVELPAASPGVPHRHRWLRLRPGHCAVDQPQAA